MIHPSYVDLMRVVNNESVRIGEEPVINSRYSIVIATAKRARQIIAGDDPMIVEADGKKPLSIAVDELNKGLVRIISEEEAESQKEELLKERQNPESGYEDDWDEYDDDEQYEEDGKDLYTEDETDEEADDDAAYEPEAGVIEDDVQADGFGGA